MHRRSGILLITYMSLMLKVPASAPDWYNKGSGMCYPVCGMMHIKELLLLIRKSNPCGGSGFPLLLSKWSFTICLMPYNHKYNMLSVVK